MNRLRNRLILIFLAATLAPLGATLWYTNYLFKLSLSYNSVEELDQVSKSLQQTLTQLVEACPEHGAMTDCPILASLDLEDTYAKR